MDKNSLPKALTGITVLEIAGPLGAYCGKLFADLGAEVILIEPPQGHEQRSRNIKNGNLDSKDSLSFQYHHTNKKSITLDIHSAAGKDSLQTLVKQADLLIESFAPGEMSRLGLGYEQLKQDNQSIVVLSLTPFGQTGPYAHWRATDLVAMAMGGMLYLGGYEDAEPVVAYGEQAIGAVSMFGAVAGLAAIYHAEITGQGQHIDVSMQECVVMGMENAIQFYELEGTIRKRTGGAHRFAGTGVFPCKDGYVYLMASGVGGNQFWPITCQWLMHEQVAGAEQLLEEKWADDTYHETPEAKEIFVNIFQDFAKKHTKEELYQKARSFRVPLAPIKNPSELNDEQRQYRHYFIETGDAGAKIKMPGAPYILSATPWAISSPAPALGEHNQEIESRFGIHISSFDQEQGDG